MTRREAVRVVRFGRASLIGADGGRPCAITELSATGALLTLTAELPRPPLRLEFELGEERFAIELTVLRAPAGRPVAVAFVDPPVDRLHRQLAVEQRLALARGRPNVRERRARGRR